MSAHPQNTPPAWYRWLHKTFEGIALMSAAEQTRLSWAQSVRAVAEIPQFYLDYLQANLPELNACLPAVLTPTFRGFLRRENEKLVFLHGERLFILEQAPSGLQSFVFPFHQINVIEVGAILLKAWLRVSGLIDGQLASQTLKYNTVTQFLFNPLVTQIRDAQCDLPAQADLQLERSRFDPLRERHFKFMSYARKSLMPGERVIDYLMQPEMRASRLNLLGRTVAMRTIDTAHLCLLTESELVVIRDDPNSLTGCDNTRYGGVWDFLPLSRIQGVGLEERADGLALALRLPGDERFEVLFSPDRRYEVERLFNQLQASSDFRR